MSHIEILQDRTKVRKRDVIDDLKEFIAHYEFYDDECHRLWKDYEELEAKHEKALKTNEGLTLALSDKVWLQMHRSAIIKKANRRRYAR